MFLHRRCRGRARTPAALIGLAAGLVVFAAKDACAYIDPGTASYSVQMIAAVIGGAALAVRQFWRRLRTKLVGHRKDETAHTTADGENPAPESSGRES